MECIGPGAPLSSLALGGSPFGAGVKCPSSARLSCLAVRRGLAHGLRASHKAEMSARPGHSTDVNVSPRSDLRRRGQDRVQGIGAPRGPLAAGPPQGGRHRQRAEKGGAKLGLFLHGPGECKRAAGTKGPLRPGVRGQEVRAQRLPVINRVLHVISDSAFLSFPQFYFRV